MPVYLSWKISISRTNGRNPSQILSVFKNYSQRLLMPGITKLKRRCLINYLFYCSNCACVQKAKRIFILHYLCVLSSASDWTHYSTRGSRYLRLLSVDPTEPQHGSRSWSRPLWTSSGQVLDKTPPGAPWRVSEASSKRLSGLLRGEYVPSLFLTEASSSRTEQIESGS